MDDLHISPSRFEKVKQMGNGRNGKVYLVKEKGNGRNYTIKFLKLISEKKMQSFLDSIQDQKKNGANRDFPKIKYSSPAQNVASMIETQSKLSHPAILPPCGFSLPEPSKKRPMSIVTNFQENGSLKTLIHTPELTTPAVKMNILFGLAEGMRYLHENGFVHSDLHPGNVLMTNDFNPLIVDFALNQFYDSAESNTNNEYDVFFPQNFDGKNPTQKDDVYCYGVIAYALLTNDFPKEKLCNLFSEDSGVYNSSNIWTGDLGKTTGTKWRELIVGCCQKDPQKRPSFDSIVLSFLRGDLTLPFTNQQEFIIVKKYMATCVSPEFSTIKLAMVLNELKSLKQDNKHLSSVLRNIHNDLEEMKRNMNKFNENFEPQSNNKENYFKIRQSEENSQPEVTARANSNVVLSSQSFTHMKGRLTLSQICQENSLKQGDIPKGNIPQKQANSSRLNTSPKSNNSSNLSGVNNAESLIPQRKNHTISSQPVLKNSLVKQRRSSAKQPMRPMITQNLSDMPLSMQIEQRQLLKLYTGRRFSNASPKSNIKESTSNFEVKNNTPELKNEQVRNIKSEHQLKHKMDKIGFIDNESNNVLDLEQKPNNSPPFSQQIQTSDMSNKKNRENQQIDTELTTEKLLDYNNSLIPHNQENEDSSENAKDVTINIKQNDFSDDSEMLGNIRANPIPKSLSMKQRHSIALDHSNLPQVPDDDFPVELLSSQSRKLTKLGITQNMSSTSVLSGHLFTGNISKSSSTASQTTFNMDMISPNFSSGSVSIMNPFASMLDQRNYSFPYNPGLQFDGILSHLFQIHGSDMFEKGIVTITGNSADRVRDIDLRELINFEWKKCWTSANVPNSFLQFDFGKHMVAITHYTIKTYPCGPNYSHLKSWTLEGYKGGQWFELDKRENCNDLNGKSKICTFSCSFVEEFNIIRLRSTGPNHYGDNYLIVTNIEFFGDFFE